MKLKAILLIVIVSVSSLSANDFSLVDMEAQFKESLNPNKTHFDDLLESSISFSQDDYNVGDIIDITIHFKVNTIKNVENLKFAILDYKYAVFYNKAMRNLSLITQFDLDSMVESMNRNDPCVLIESDPDLILSNDHPTGSYNLKFRLIGKTNGTTVLDNQYPYIMRSMTIFPFYESVEYECLTDYIEVGIGSGFTIHIKIKSASMEKKEPSTEPKKIGQPPYAPDINPTEGRKIKTLDDTRERIELKVLSGKTTFVGELTPEPYGIYHANPDIGNVTIEFNYQGTGYNYIKIEAEPYTNNNFYGLVTYIDQYDQLVPIWIRIVYTYDLTGNIRMHSDLGDYVLGNGTMQITDSEGSPYGDPSIIDESGYYLLNNFTPDDNLGYFAVTDQASILEYHTIYGAIVSNFVFNLTPQIVFAALNLDDEMIHLFFHEIGGGFMNDIYYIQDAQIVADNYIFDFQKRAEIFSTVQTYKIKGNQLDLFKKFEVIFCQMKEN